MLIRNSEAEKGNRIYWNEIAPVHLKSYDIGKLRSGGHLIDEIQIAEMGNVRGKELLHLQCHIGSDSLSWVHLGATVTGVDFSDKSIELAKNLSEELGIEASFICSNIYDLPDHLNKKFDIVYTSQGVLCWLSDLKRWGELIERYLKPDGFFYIMEHHPVFHILDESGTPNLLVKNPYFHNLEPVKWDGGYGDYSDPDFIGDKPSYEWQWSLGDIVNALISVGLRIEFLNEYDRIFYKAPPDMIRNNDGWWYLPENKPKVPLMFTLKACK